MHQRADNLRPTSPPFDVEAVRRDFPILSRKVNGHPLVYLDNGATTQKPRAVIDALVEFYTQHNANVHRGVHTLSQEASALFDDARVTVAEFINAPEPAECVFVRPRRDGGDQPRGDVLGAGELEGRATKSY